MSTIKTLFIDYDNTLHDSDSVYFARLDGVLGQPGARIWEAYFEVHRELVHLRYPDQHDDMLFHMRHMFDLLRKPYDEREARRIAGLFCLAQEECWTEPVFFSDTFSFLDRVKREYTLCLATGEHAPQKVRAIETISGKMFQSAFDLDNVGIKGSSSYFRNALTMSGSRAEDCAMIGDSLPHDITAAKEAGLETIWINRKGKPLPADAVPPHHEVRGLMEILKYI